MLAVDGHGERFRTDFNFWGSGISDHIALAYVAHISHRHHLSAKPQSLLDPGSMSDAGDERDAVSRQRITVGPEHRPIVGGLRRRQRRVWIAHNRPAYKTVLDDEFGLGAEERGLPQDEVGDLADLDRAQHIGNTVRDRGLIVIFAT